MISARKEIKLAIKFCKSKPPLQRVADRPSTVDGPTGEMVGHDSRQILNSRLLQTRLWELRPDEDWSRAFFHYKLSSPFPEHSEQEYRRVSTLVFFFFTYLLFVSLTLISLSFISLSIYLFFFSFVFWCAA